MTFRTVITHAGRHILRLTGMGGMLVCAMVLAMVPAGSMARLLGGNSETERCPQQGEDTTAGSAVDQKQSRLENRPRRAGQGWVSVRTSDTRNQQSMASTSVAAEPPSSRISQQSDALLLPLRC